MVERHGRGQPKRLAAARPTSRRSQAAAWEDALLDEAIEETFPASDPIAPFCKSGGVALGRARRPGKARARRGLI